MAILAHFEVPKWSKSWILLTNNCQKCNDQNVVFGRFSISAGWPKDSAEIFRQFDRNFGFGCTQKITWNDDFRTYRLFGIKNCIFGVGIELTLGSISIETFSFNGKSHIRGGDTVTLVISNNFDSSVFDSLKTKTIMP